MNILFVCKYNRFRSVVAESYFNKVMRELGKSRYKAKSAGIIFNIPINQRIRKVCKKSGLAIKGNPKGLDMNLLRWADYIIIVANDVPPNIFDYPKKLGKKIIVWKIKDAKNRTNQEKERIIRLIQQKVNDFVKSL